MKLDKTKYPGDERRKTPITVRLSKTEWAWFIGVTFSMVAGGVIWWNTANINHTAFAEDTKFNKAKNIEQDLTLKEYKIDIKHIKKTQDEFRTEQKTQSTLLNQIYGKLTG